MGEEFSNRGARADEIIEILHRLWTQDTIEFHGEHYDFEPVKFEPKPVQKPHPPVLFGGLSPAALARAARLDGCFLPTNDLDQIVAALATMTRLRAQAGVTTPYDMTVVAPFPMTVESLEQLETLGVTRVLFEVGHSPLEADPPPVPITARALRANLEEVASQMSDYLD
jgi:alkanesulfonate monooxygenase SsuD/methylene tetrahydromethanopterin reductase-like flavin-dependent oxidoreductase (luciferase family)